MRAICHIPLVEPVSSLISLVLLILNGIVKMKLPKWHFLLWRICENEAYAKEFKNLKEVYSSIR